MVIYVDENMLAIIISSTFIAFVIFRIFRRYLFSNDQEEIKMKFQLNTDKLNGEQEDKKDERAHELKIRAQDHMYEILKDTFGKVKNVEASEAAYCAVVLGNQQRETECDKDVLDIVASKVSTPAIAQIDQAVFNAITGAKKPEMKKCLKDISPN